jgi:hypothetical protein
VRDGEAKERISLRTVRGRGERERGRERGREGERGRARESEGERGRARESEGGRGERERERLKE